MEEEMEKNIEVQTFTKDMAKVIEGAEGGFIKKIIHEQEANEERKKSLPKEGRRNITFLIVGACLIIFALAFLFFLATHKKENTLNVSNSSQPLIYSDQSSVLEISELSRDEIIETILTETFVSELKTDGIKAFYFSNNKNIIGLREFLKLIKSNFAIENNKFLEDNFLLGYLNNENKDLFILMKIRSLSDVFENLRQWENKMFLDLHRFWSISITPETEYLINKNFEDGIIQNKNARILYDNDGQIVMMYVFTTENSLVISNNEKLIAEIILRLSSSKLKK